MLQLLEQSEGRVIGIRIAGKITRDDYKAIVPRIEQAIKEHGKLALLIQLESLGGLEFGAFWEDVKFTLKHFLFFDRIALVGDKRWHKPYLGAIRTLTPAKGQYFPTARIDDAWQWVKAREEARV